MPVKLLSFLLLPTLAFAEIKSLPVTCVAPQEVKEAVSTQNNVLLRGYSEIYQRPTLLLYNTQTETYVSLLFTDKNEVCFVDIGKGTTKAFGTKTTR